MASAQHDVLYGPHEFPEGQFGGSSLGFFPWQGTLFENPAGQIPTNTFISEPNFDRYETGQIAAGYLLQHQFNNRWTIRQNFNYTESNADYQTVYSRFDPGPMLNEDNRTINREIYIDYAKARSPVVDTQLETHFNTGGFRHNVLFGVDYQQSTINDQWGYDFAPPIDVFEPVYGNFTVPPLNSTPEARQNQIGVYGQDHIQFAEHWSVMLGVRKDRASSESEGDPEADVDSTVTGRAGLVYTTNSGLAPYFSFSQSFQPLAGTDVLNNPYKPIRAKQWEAGAKFQPGGSENMLGAALFDIREENRLTADPANPMNSIQVGEAHIRGLELEARTKPFWDLNLIVNYNFLDARISKSNDVDMGKRVAVIPKHYASLWAVKDFRFQGVPGFFSAGGGIRYNGSTFGGDDIIKAPSYTLYDLMFSYDNTKWRFAINFANLTDEIYLASCLSRGDCFFGMRRNIVASIGYRF